MGIRLAFGREVLFCFLTRLIAIERVESESERGGVLALCFGVWFDFWTVSLAMFWGRKHGTVKKREVDWNYSTWGWKCHNAPIVLILTVLAYHDFFHRIAFFPMKTSFMKYLINHISLEGAVDFRGCRIKFYIPENPLHEKWHDIKATSMTTRFCNIQKLCAL